MLPRLRAQERLDRIDDGALASGFVKQVDRQRALAALECAARGDEPEPPAKPSPAELSGMGIGFVVANDVSPVGEEGVSNG